MKWPRNMHRNLDAVLGHSRAHSARSENLLKILTKRNNLTFWEKKTFFCKQIQNLRLQNKVAKMRGDFDFDPTLPYLRSLAAWLAPPESPTSSGFTSTSLEGVTRPSPPPVTWNRLRKWLIQSDTDWCIVLKMTLAKICSHGLSSITYWWMHHV